MAKLIYGVDNKNYVDVMVEIVHDTDKLKAMLVSDGDHEEWIPKSLIEGVENGNGDGKTVIITIPEWLAKDKGFI